MSEQDNREAELSNTEELEINLEEEVGDESEDESEDKDALLAKKDNLIRQLTKRLHSKNDGKSNFSKPESKKESKDDIRQTVKQLELAEQKRQFGYTNKLSPEETDYMFKINPNPTSELLSDPFIKGGLEAIRKSKRVEENTPAFGSRSQRFEITKKADMTSEDKQKAFEEFMASKRSR